MIQVQRIYTAGNIAVNTHRFCFLRSMIDIIIEADEFSETDFLWHQYYFQYS